MYKSRNSYKGKIILKHAIKGFFVIETSKSKEGLSYKPSREKHVAKGLKYSAITYLLWF